MDQVLLDDEVAAALAEMPPLVFNPDTVKVMRETGLAAAAELSDAVERTDHVVSEDPRVVVRVHRAKGATAPAVPLLDPRRRLRHRGYDMDDAKFDQLCVSCLRRGVGGVPPGARDRVSRPARGLLRGPEVDLRPRRRARRRPRPHRHRGISAGGGLAAALALLARDRGEIRSRSSCSSAR